MPKTQAQPKPKQPEPVEEGRGIFISFEGSEGCGKTTQITRVARRLEDEGNDVIVTREPGGTDLGEEIRHLLMHAQSGNEMCPETELLLFAASRAQLVRQVLLPALESGKIILCDRFLDSTTVYQGIARNISSEPVQIINSFAAGNMMPDLTIILDVPAKVGLTRIRHRVGETPNRMEKESIDFYERVREGYLVLARELPQRFFVVDGSKSEEEVEEEIWNELRRRFD